MYLVKWANDTYLCDWSYVAAHSVPQNGWLQRDAIGGIVYRKATYCSDKRLALSLGGLVETFNGSCQDFAQEGRHGRRHENRAATTHSLLQS